MGATKPQPKQPGLQPRRSKQFRSPAALEIAVASRFPRQSVLMVKSVFDATDLDKDGSVSLRELILNLKKDERLVGQRFQHTDEEVLNRVRLDMAKILNLAESMFMVVDRDGSGSISFAEFLTMTYPDTTKKERDILLKWVAEAEAPAVAAAGAPVMDPEQVEEIRGIFTVYDVDNNGVLDKEELLSALTAAGYDRDDIIEVFEIYLKDRDVMGFDDFIALMSGSFDFKKQAELYRRASASRS